MTDMSGVFSQEKSSRNYPGDLTRSLSLREALVLLGVGASAVVLHQILRMPLGLPGRHGVEWMALLIMARSRSRFKYAGSLSSIGASAAALLPFWAFDDPYIWLIYLVPGLLMDLIFNLKPDWRVKIGALIAVGGLAHATKPLIRWIIALATGWPYGSLLYGVLYPTATHILFGMVGGFIGAVLALGIDRYKKQA